MPGIVNVVTINNSVAVVGKSIWQVKKAKDTLKIEWEKDGIWKAPRTTTAFQEMLDSPNTTVRRKDGDVETAFKNAAKVVKANTSVRFCRTVHWNR